MALTQSNNHTFSSGELVTATKLNNVKAVQTDTATNNNNFTGSAGQLTFDTTANKLRVHDGSTAGGLEVGAGAGSVTSTEIASNAVTTAKIADDAVTTAKINDDAVTTAKIADDAVGADQLDESQSYEVSGLHSNGANMQITRASEGPGLRFVYDAATDEVRDLFVDANGAFQFTNVSGGGTQGTLMTLDDDGNLKPGSNGVQDLGGSSTRWRDVWSSRAAFNGSDRNLKQDIEDLSEAEKKVAVKAKGLLKKYRLKDSVESKGDDARIHVGIIAQELQEAFESEGLDAFRYSMLGKDTWWEKINDEGKREVKEEATEGYTEVTQMSIRYSELLAFIISAL